jgi:serpin B
MLIVLPTTDGARTVKSTDLIGALDKLESSRVALSLPKFNFESTYENDLTEALIALGLGSLFKAENESFCGLLQNSSCLVISLVIQKTSIAVDEKGVEAAATTAVKMNGMSFDPTPPILMRVDHPFQFFIYDEKEELMLFEGRLGLQRYLRNHLHLCLMPITPTLTFGRSTSVPTLSIHLRPLLQLQCFKLGERGLGSNQ